MHFGADCLNLVEFGATWRSLMQIGVVWCNLVLFGSVWCFLVHFGQGVRKVSFTSTSLKVIFTRPEKFFREQNKKIISYSFLNFTVS